ncbi:MAG: TraB/GumN family protein [Verrucomicrobia bacterium]|nr:TraB/GumN family protein [Verrucomicrobiota bacterium]
MSMKLVISLFFAAALVLCAKDGDAACVWRVTGANGHTLYLGGSMHALRSTDYPLPAAYNLAFNASSRLAFEQDPKQAAAAFKDIVREGQYAKGDSLKNHVDPRTYEYLRRFFALRGISEDKFSRLKLWYIDVLFELPPPQLSQLGVEQFLWHRAVANAKPVTGLESRQEHSAIFTGLSDRDSEAVLLIGFINAAHKDPKALDTMVAAWRRGDADALTRRIQENYRDFPSFYDRLVTARNRNWLPKIKGYLNSGGTYFVIAGAAHMGGPDGLVALLRASGYKVEQL